MEVILYKMKYAGLRVDIDGVKDAELLPLLLDMLNRQGIKATFFLTSGPDNTAWNMRHYVNPRTLIRRRAFKRYGRHMLNGLLFKRQVLKSKNIDLILDNGHELGLHGYDHYNWMNHLDAKSGEEIHALIARGCELFEQTFGFYPKSFASPGFKVTPDFLSVLDDFEFYYASDFIGGHAFYPEIEGKVCRTLQIPVSMRSLGEHEETGLSDAQILGAVEEKLNRFSPFILYCHPSYEPVFKPALLDRILTSMAETTQVMTLDKIASRVKEIIRSK